MGGLIALLIIGFIFEYIWSLKDRNDDSYKAWMDEEDLQTYALRSFFDFSKKI